MAHLVRLSRMLPTPSLLLYAVLAAIAATGVGGCGGKMAESGWAAVGHVNPDGATLLHKPGKTEWKRIHPDQMPASARIAAKNVGKPARFVETKNGGTLTFPEGDTIIYRDFPKEK